MVDDVFDKEELSVFDECVKKLYGLHIETLKHFLQDFLLLILGHKLVLEELLDVLGAFDILFEELQVVLNNGDFLIFGGHGEEDLCVSALDGFLGGGGFVVGDGFQLLCLGKTSSRNLSQ